MWKHVLILIAVGLLCSMCNSSNKSPAINESTSNGDKSDNEIDLKTNFCSLFHEWDSYKFTQWKYDSTNHNFIPYKEKTGEIFDRIIRENTELHS